VSKTYSVVAGNITPKARNSQSESAAFRKKLDTRPVFEAWLQDINRRNMGVDGRLFEIVRLRGGGFQLAVNFDPQIVTLFKEVRNLLWLNFQVAHAITNMAKDAKRVYPHAVSLMETVRTYGQSLDLVEKNKGIEWLVSIGMSRRGLVFSFVCSFIKFSLFSVDRHEHPMGLFRQPIRYLAICAYFYFFSGSLVNPNINSDRRNDNEIGIGMRTLQLFDHRILSPNGHLTIMITSSTPSYLV
jgi:hypothetical protein